MKTSFPFQARACQRCGVGFIASLHSSHAHTDPQVECQYCRNLPKPLPPTERTLMQRLAMLLFGASISLSLFGCSAQTTNPNDDPGLAPDEVNKDVETDYCAVFTFCNYGSLLSECESMYEHAHKQVDCGTVDLADCRQDIAGATCAQITGDTQNPLTGTACSFCIQTVTL